MDPGHGGAVEPVMLCGVDCWKGCHDSHLEPAGWPEIAGKPMCGNWVTTNGDEYIPVEQLLVSRMAEGPRSVPGIS